MSLHQFKREEKSEERVEIVIEKDQVDTYYC